MDAAGVLLMDLEDLADALEALAEEVRRRKGVKAVA